jgi:hypothetical protein
MNVFSGAGTVEAYLVDATNWADLSGGYQYSIVLQNPSGADITSGELHLECAHARHDNLCEPDTWAPLSEPLGCSSVLNNSMVEDPAVIAISEDNPIPAGSQCSFSAPCPCQFLRVTGAPAGLNVIVVVSRLRRTGGPAIPAKPVCP